MTPEPTPTHPILVDAIHSHSIIAFDYDGQRRIVEPYTYGITARGREMMRGYQISGASTSDPIPGWRMFDLGRVSGISLLGERFSRTRPEYNPDDHAMATLFARVEVGPSTEAEHHSHRG